MPEAQANVHQARGVRCRGQLQCGTSFHCQLFALAMSREASIGPYVPPCAIKGDCSVCLRPSCAYCESQWHNSVLKHMKAPGDGNNAETSPIAKRLLSPPRSEQKCRFYGPPAAKGPRSPMRLTTSTSHIGNNGKGWSAAFCATRRGSKNAKDESVHVMPLLSLLL